MCYKLGITNLKLDKLTLVCIGCSGKAEERILNQTNCYEELQYCFPMAIKHIEVWLVGPEMTKTQSPTCTHKSNHRISFHLYKGTAIDYVREHPSSINHNLTNQTSVFIGLNCGFGNWDRNVDVRNRFNLLLAWMNDLYFLTGTKMPLLFTCANDYEDVVGETLVMSKILGAKYILIPVENKFSYASTLVQNLPKNNTKEAAREATSDNYSMGNSFMYAVQSYDPKRRQKLNLKDKNEFLVGILKTVTATKSNNHQEYFQPISFAHIVLSSNTNSNTNTNSNANSNTNANKTLKNMNKIKNEKDLKETVKKTTKETKHVSIVSPPSTTPPMPTPTPTTTKASSTSTTAITSSSTVVDIILPTPPAPASTTTTTTPIIASTPARTTSSASVVEEVPTPDSTPTLDAKPKYHIEQYKVSDEILKINIKLVQVDVAGVVEVAVEQKRVMELLELLQHIEFYIDNTGEILQITSPNTVNTTSINNSIVSTPTTASTCTSHVLQYRVNPKTIKGKLRKKTVCIEILAEIV